MNAVVWPDKPICHGARSPFSDTEVIWRPPSGGDKLSPYDYPFRTCSYCGSMHPEDLLAAIAAGARLGSSDWKYGWPHKFYVEAIPNPAAGQLRGGSSVGLGSGLTLEEVQARCPGYTDWTKGQHGWSGVKYSPAPAATHAKWYNDHLLDLSPEAFAVVAPVLKEKAGIEFTMEDGKLKYRAPSPGYQA